MRRTTLLSRIYVIDKCSNEFVKHLNGKQCGMCVCVRIEATFNVNFASFEYLVILSMRKSDTLKMKQADCPRPIELNYFVKLNS